MWIVHASKRMFGLPFEKTKKCQTKEQAVAAKRALQKLGFKVRITEKK